MHYYKIIEIMYYAKNMHYTKKNCIINKCGKMNILQVFHVKFGKLQNQVLNSEQHLLDLFLLF